MINSKWKMKPLRELCKKIGDGIHSTPNYVNNSGFHFINGNNLKNGFIVINENTKKISEIEFNKYYIELDDNTLLMSINGTLGSLALYRGESVILGKSAAYMSFSSINTLFCYYYLQLKNVQNQLYNEATGSTIKNLSLESLKNLQVPVPTVNEQKKIVSILSNLDAKITINNRINAELETMAKTLYDYWFVQFDFPDAEGKPYKASGGQMIWNQELKREIPEEWKVGSIMKVGNLLGGGTPKTNTECYWNGPIPFFTPRDYQDSFFVTKTNLHVTDEGLQSCSTKLFPKGTVFITARGTVGKINIASEDMAMNQSCYAVTPKENINYYFLHQCCVDLVQYMKSKANGSVFDAIVSNDFRATPIVIPPIGIIEKFGMISGSMYEKTLSNMKENQKLAELRDWLLPMLMNGQVKVRDAEEAVSLAIE